MLSDPVRYGPLSFEPVPPGGPTACVWELAVHAHERDASVAHVLNPPDGPDYDAYLVATLTVARIGTGELIEQFNDACNNNSVDSSTSPGSTNASQLCLPLRCATTIVEKMTCRIYMVQIAYMYGHQDNHQLR